MKKGIATFSIIISLFVLAVFVAPKHSEAGWDFSIGIGYSTDNYGYYDDYGYDTYGSGYDQYSGYPSYGYGDQYGGYSNYGYPSYDYPPVVSNIYPRQGVYNPMYGQTNIYNNYYGNQGYGCANTCGMSWTH